MGVFGGSKLEPDDDLVAWLAEGYDRSYRTAYLILHNRQDAEEAVQEAFLRAWRFRSAVPTGDRAGPWLYRVVVNSCISKLRSDRNRRDRSSPLDDAGVDTAAVRAERDTSPEPAAEFREAQRAVVEAVASLPEPLRVVIVLRFYAQLTEKEIAAAIGRRPGTVKSRVHEAKTLLARNAALIAVMDTPVAIADGGRDGR